MAYFFRSYTWLFLILISASLPAQNSGLTGLPLIYNYPPSSYGYHPQNWSAVQDGRGMMYFANTDGILEYDGVNWRIIRMPHGDVCRTLFRASDGTIYAGGYNEIGKLVSDTKGKTEYRSLRSSLAGLPKEFFDVWSITELNGAIYFSTYNNIFILRGNRFTNIESATTVNSMKNLGGRIIVARSGRLPEILSGPGFIPLVDAVLQPTVEIFTTADGGDNSIIAIGRKGEFFSIRDGKIRQLSNGLDIFREKSNFFDAVRLSDGNIALATIKRGLVICTPEGSIARMLDESLGFGNNSVYAIYEDGNKNLWLMLEDGISRINLTDPVSVFDKRVSLPGSIGDVTFTDDRVFVITSFGVYSSNSPAGSNIPLFSKYPGDFGDGWRIAAFGADIFAATSNGLFLLKNNSKVQIDSSFCFDLRIPSEEPDVILLATDKGLKVLRTTAGNRGNVISSFSVKGAENELREVFQSRNGEFWVSTLKGSIYRIIFKDGYAKQPEVTVFTESELNIGYLPQAIVIGENVLAVTGQGIHYFDDRKNRFVKLQTSGFIPATDPYSYPILTNYKNGEFIFYNEGTLFRAKPDFSAKTCSFDRIGKIRSTSLYKLIYERTNHESDLWIATSSGLIRYEVGRNSSTMKTNPVIRSVVVTDSVYFFGATAAGEELEIEPGNNVKITFAALGISDESNLLFETWMTGIDTTWQPLFRNNSREFARLAPGDYTFRVRAILPNGEYSDTATIDIHVADHWYANFVAYFLYALIVFGGFLAFTRWRTVKLKNERAQLEAAVNDRTRELKAAMDEINSRNALLKESNSKLEKLDREKSEYLGIVAHDLKSPITGVMGFAELIADELEELEQDDVKRFAQNIVSSSGKILETINRLLDVSMIEEGKIELRIEEFDLVDLLGDSVSMMIPGARKKNISISFRSDEEKLMIQSDRSLCGQIIDNLLSNALKYSFPGSQVKARIMLENQTAKIEIEDHGQGIAENELPFLFDKFKRLSSKPTAGESSSGLGLTIVKSLTELLKGDIEVKSQVGEGTTFTIKLPLKFRK